MLVIDVPWEVLKKMRTDLTLKLFYLEKDDTLELYTITNGTLFRSIMPKPTETEQIFFGETYLRDAVRIMGISQINEAEWGTIITGISNKLDEILEELRKK